MATQALSWIIENYSIIQHVLFVIVIICNLKKSIHVYCKRIYMCIVWITTFMLVKVLQYNSVTAYSSESYKKTSSKINISTDTI